MWLALRAAASAPRRQKIGAAVVSGKRVQSFKSNIYRNSPRSIFLTRRSTPRKRRYEDFRTQPDRSCTWHESGW